MGNCDSFHPRLGYDLSLEVRGLEIYIEVFTHASMSFYRNSNGGESEACSARARCRPANFNARSLLRGLLILMLIGDISGKAEFFVCLAQELFGSRSVAAELAVVGPLCIADVVEGLDNVVLRGGKIAMAVAVDIDVGRWYTLGKCHGA